MVLTEESLLAATKNLLAAIKSKNWKAYEELVDPSITCFEPEGVGYLVEGLPFHQFYFNLQDEVSEENPPNLNYTLVRPHVRILSDTAAVVSYVRLIQSLDGDGRAETSWYEETRVWQVVDGKLKNVHFHRSGNV